MSDGAVTLDLEQRRLVERTIVDHCSIRNWVLYAVNCRSNHAHAVLTAPGRKIEVPREQLKSWCTRKLKDRERALAGDRAVVVREDWWTERGWDEYIDDEESLDAVVGYTLEGQ